MRTLLDEAQNAGDAKWTRQYPRTWGDIAEDFDLKGVALRKAELEADLYYIVAQIGAGMGNADRYELS